MLCVEQAEKENDISLVSKANALKGKIEEKKENVAILKGALSLLEEEEKKLNWRSLILKACVMLCFYIILLKICKFLLLFSSSFIWYWKFIFFS